MTRVFTDIWFDPVARFAVGVEQATGQHYVSIPVSNARADYEEYYAIDAATAARYLADPGAAAGFVARCRARACDHLLIVAAGPDRGASS